jgi:hypothetical protein
VSESIIFSNPKVIYIISPQPWSGFRVSKHHYALELAELGHEVFFIEAPDRNADASITVRHTDVPNIKSVTYRTWFPYQLKFHARPAFDLCMKRQAQLIIKKIGKRPEIVWDFDVDNRFNDLRAFKAPLSIFHVMDKTEATPLKSKHEDIAIAVNRKFLHEIGITATDENVVGHGLSREYAAFAQELLKSKQASGIPREKTVAYVGNLEHVGVDWPTISQMVYQNTTVRFMFIGPYNPDDARYSHLLSQVHCSFTGRLSAEEILKHADTVDVWLVCYDKRLTSNGGVNSHKILEYLATGRSVLSNFIEAYECNPVITMGDKSSNAQLPAKLREMLGRIDDENSAERQRQRAKFALESSYLSNLRQIDAALVNYVSHVPQRQVADPAR